MTVSVTTASKSYTGTGSQTIFGTGFVFSTPADIEVIERNIDTGAEIIKVLTTDYTVTGGGGAGASPAVGDVVANVPPPITVEWHIRRVIAETQETDLPVAGSLPSNAVEQMGDRAVMMIQQHSEEIGRGLSFPKTDDENLDPTLPSSVDRAGKFLSFDSEGKPSVGESPGLKLTDGSAVAPSLTFASDTDVGFFKAADNTMGFAAGGGEMVRFDDFGIAPLDGTAGQPAYTFNSDRDTGLYRISANRIGIATGGAGRVQIHDGGIETVNGSAAAPAFTFDGDEDTGVFRNGADQIGIAAGGVSRAVFATSTDGAVALIKGGLRFDSTRSAAPTLGMTIDYGASVGRFSVQSGGGFAWDENGTEHMRLVAADGNLLLGHNTADDAASVQGALQIHGTSTNTSGMNLFSWQAGAGESRLVLAKSRSATPGSHTIVQNGDPLGRIIFAGDDGAGLTSQAADINVNVDGVPSSNDMPGKLRFGTTAAGDSSPTTRMTITSAGEVTMPSQPAMLASVPANIPNVTGDGTTYTVVFGAAIFDQGTNWDGSTTFTAPVGGRYQVDVCILVSGMTSNNTTGRVSIVTSNRTYDRDINPFATANSANQVSITSGVLADMDSGDTLTVSVTVSSTDKGVTVLGMGNEFSWLSVYLVA